MCTIFVCCTRFPNWREHCCLRFFSKCRNIKTVIDQTAQDFHAGITWCTQKSAYCLIAREETASRLIEHHAAVKMEYIQKQCVHLLWHFLLKPCAATADLCCPTSTCYWCFSIHIVMEIWSLQYKPGHTPIPSFKRQRILLYIVGRRPKHWRSVFPKCCWWVWSSCKHTAEWLSWLAFSWLHKPLWWMQCLTSTKRDLSQATSTEVGCLVRKAYHSNCFVVCLHDLSHQHSDRQTDRTLCVYLFLV